MRAQTVIVLILFGFNSMAQRSRIPAFLTVVGNDSVIEVDMLADQTVISGKLMVNPLAWYENVYFEKNDSIFTIQESNIERIEFFEEDSVKRIVLSEKQAKYQYPKENLVELLHKGTISWYTDWKPGVSTTATTSENPNSNAALTSVGKPNKSHNNNAVFTGAVIGGVIGALVASAITTETEYGSELLNFKRIDGYLVKEKNGVLTHSSEQQGSRYHQKYMNLDYMIGDRPDLNHKVEEIQNDFELLSLLKEYDIPRVIIRENKMAKSNQSRLDKLKSDSTISYLPVIDIYECEENEELIYLSKSGEKVAFLLKPINSSFAKINYYDDQGNREEAIVKVKDLRFIK